jgi:hypothetical protein
MRTSEGEVNGCEDGEIVEDGEGESATGEEHVGMEEVTAPRHEYASHNI